MVVPDESLTRLCHLLGLPPDTHYPTVLQSEHFAAWKPRAEALSRAKHRDASEVAALLTNLASARGDRACQGIAFWIAGNIHHDLSAMIQADAAYRQAETTFAALGDWQSIARMSVGWVHVLGELGQAERALRYAEAAEAVLSASSDPADAARLANLYGNRGIVHEQTGHLVAALEEYERKWTYFRTLPDGNVSAAVNGAMALNDIGVVLTLLGQYRDADRTLRLALQRLAPHVADPLVHAEKTLVLMNLAWLAATRSSGGAIVRKAFQQARAGRALLDDQAKAQVHFAYIDLDEANWLIRHDRWRDVDAEALAHLRTLVAAHGVEFEATYAGLLLGQLAFYAGEVDTARRTFAALAARALEQTPTLAYLAYLWEARALRTLGHDQQAATLLTQAIDLVEQTRQRLTLDDYRAGYLEDKLVAYQEMAALHLAQGDSAAALAISERSKARTLAEAIGATAAEPPSVPAPPTAVGEPWSTVAIAAHLPADALAICYAQIHTQLWAFLIDHSGLIEAPLCLGPVPSRAELESGRQRLEQILSAGELTPETIREQIAVAQGPLHTWYAAYLAPLQPWLDRYARLVIVPDGLLHSLPFACLYDAQRQRYLVESHEVIMVPSLATWPSLQAAYRMGQPSRGAVLVVGNASRNGEPDALPATRVEAAAVGQLFTGAHILCDAAATTAQFKAHAGTAPLIYLAAHGEHHIGEPSASFVELADRPLHVRDILELHLPGSVIILNACDSSRGHLVGNEMMGLVRSFFYAGACAVVAAQWQVEDNAGLHLMTQIMRDFQGGRALASALQRAQQQAIRAGDSYQAHPFFWGSYAVAGAGNALLAGK